MTWHDDEEDAEDGDEDLGPDESDRADEPAEVPCPYCKHRISEDADRCPYCGSYILPETDLPARRSWWWIVAVVLLVFLILRYVLKC